MQDDKTAPFRQQADDVSALKHGTRVSCMPTAVVLPKLQQGAKCAVVTTTVINLGTDDLVIRKGDIIARAYLVPEYTDAHLQNECQIIEQAQASPANKQFEQLQASMRTHSEEITRQQQKAAQALTPTACYWAVVALLLCMCSVALWDVVHSMRSDVTAIGSVAAANTVGIRASLALRHRNVRHSSPKYVEQQYVAAASLQHTLTQAPLADGATDGLPANHPHFEVEGAQSVASVKDNDPEFIAWIKEFSGLIEVGIPELRMDVLKLLYCYREVFAANTTAPNPIHDVEHAIHLISNPIPVPRKDRLRRCSPRELKAMYDETEKMLKNGIIRPSSSPWAAQVILVPKPRDPLGGLRYAVDYRYLNSCSHADCMILPRVDDLLDSLSNAEVMSFMDMAAGFWACKIKPDHCYLTAFNTWTHGQMEFIRMPFDLKNAPATYQRMMQNVLHGYLHDFGVQEACYVPQSHQINDSASSPRWGSLRRKIASLYLDDVCVHGKTHNHINDLARILKRLRGNNISVKLVVPVSINKEWTRGTSNRTSEVPGRYQSPPPRTAGLTVRHSGGWACLICSPRAKMWGFGLVQELYPTLRCCPGLLRRRGTPERPTQIHPPRSGSKNQRGVALSQLPYVLRSAFVGHGPKMCDFRSLRLVCGGQGRGRTAQSRAGVPPGPRWTGTMTRMAAGVENGVKSRQNERLGLTARPKLAYLTLKRCTYLPQQWDKAHSQPITVPTINFNYTCTTNTHQHHN